MQNPLVSVIVPTKNSAQFLDVCLASIKAQRYPNIELIVVDNFSTDATQAIAKKYTNNVFEKGPERSVQRNYGVEQSHGQYILIIDSDMKLSPAVVAHCVEGMDNDPAAAGIVIPEESFGQGFWAACKKLERSYYVGVPWMEAARFFPKKIYTAAGGYDETLISGEDWDLSQRTARYGPLRRIDDFIYHDEGTLKLFMTLKKKYYYAQRFASYTAKNKGNKNMRRQTSVLNRYALFFSRPAAIFQHPIHWLGMIVMKTCEFGVGSLGYLAVKTKI